MFREVRLDISERTLKSREELERSRKLRTKGVESGPLVGPPSSCGESVGTWESEDQDPGVFTMWFTFNNTQKHESGVNACTTEVFQGKGDKLDPKILRRVETFQACHSMPVPMECGDSKGTMVKAGKTERSGEILNTKNKW